MKESLVLSGRTRRILAIIEPLVFARRKLTLSVLGIITLVLLAFASQLEPDAGYEKTIPLNHPYMAVYKQYQRDFGGANIVLVAVQNTRGDIYQPGFLEKLRKVTDDVFFLPNVDRSRVSSLFTPSTRYIEVVEDGLRGADVIPANYDPSPEMAAQIRSNVRKAGVIGRLVANDERGAMVFAEMLEVDPVTGKRINYKQVADQLEDIRAKYERDGVSIHIIGFAKVVGDMTDATGQVFIFFLLTLMLTTLLLWIYCGNLRMAVMPLACALVSVMWNFGMLVVLGMGLDPFAVLVPFLVLSISISHGVQYVNAWVTEVDAGNTSLDASLITFRRFAIPGTIALLTAVIGFVTIMIIQIEAIQDMALNASLGCLAIIITNKVLMPIWLSYMPVRNASQFKEAQRVRERLLDPCWHQLKKLTRPVPSKLVILGAILATVWGASHYKDLHIGDIQKGVPELRADSRYNQDTATIVGNYALGADILKVIAEAGPDACINYDWMEEVDSFAWRMENVDGVA
ncbi:MAG: MMPL family transporter, partial [Paraperlucidibaca sp.]